MTIAEIIDEKSKKYQLDKKILQALVHQESGGDAKAISSKGARGVMQLMPKTAASLGVADISDPEQNIEGGALYLRRLLDKYNGNMKLALAAYNAGPEAVDKYGDVPPFEETQNYVTNVMSRAGKDKMPKGVLNYEAEVEGKKFRISVPNGTREEDLPALFQAEYNRKHKESPVESSRYRVDLDPSKNKGTRFGGAALDALYSGPLTDERLSGKVSPDSSGHLSYSDLDKTTPSQRAAELGKSGIPFLSDYERLSQGDIVGEAGSVLGSMIGAPPGLGARPGNAYRQVGRGIKEGFRGAAEDVSPSRMGLAGTAGSLGGAAIAASSGHPWYEGAYMGGTAGTMASRIPAFMRGFGRGFHEPVDIPQPINSVTPEPATDPRSNLYQQTDALPPASQVFGDNAPPPTRSMGAVPLPGQPDLSTGRTTEMPAQGLNAPQIPKQIQSGPQPVITPPPVAPKALGAGGDLIRSQGAIPLKPAKMVPDYGRQNTVRSPYTGTLMKRQQELPLYNEGANLPGKTPDEITTPPKNINRQEFDEMAKTPVKEPIDLQQKIPAKTLTKAEIEKIAAVRKVSPEEQTKHFTDAGFQVVDELPKEFELKKDPNGKPAETNKIILPKAVKLHAQNMGISNDESAKFFREQGYTIQKDPFLKPKQ